MTDASTLAEINRIIKNPKDFYKILNISKDCSDSDIKKAYRKLARIIHPDKCQDAKAEEAFKLLSQANNCLSNADSRRMYNMTGSDTSDGGGSGGGFPGFPGGGFPGFQGGAGGVDMNDLFANIFAQAAQQQQQQQRRGAQPFVFTSSGFPGQGRGGFPGGMHGGGIDLDDLFRGMGAMPRQPTRSSRSQNNNNDTHNNNDTPEDPISSLIRNPYTQKIINIIKDVPPMILIPVIIFLVVQFGSLIFGFIYRKIYIMCVLFTFSPLKKYTLSTLLGLFILDYLQII